jgi:hypothetical protein
MVSQPAEIQFGVRNADTRLFERSNRVIEEGSPPCNGRRRRRPPPDCCRSDVHSGKGRTSPTSGARRASSRSGRGAPPSHGGALQVVFSGNPRLDLLEQPAVPIRILERGKRVVAVSKGEAAERPDWWNKILGRASYHVGEDLCSTESERAWRIQVLRTWASGFGSRSSGMAL